MSLVCFFLVFVFVWILVFFILCKAFFLNGMEGEMGYEGGGRKGTEKNKETTTRTTTKKSDFCLCFVFALLCLFVRAFVCCRQTTMQFKIIIIITSLWGFAVWFTNSIEIAVHLCIVTIVSGECCRMRDLQSVFFSISWLHLACTHHAHYRDQSDSSLFVSLYLCFDGYVFVFCVGVCVCIDMCESVYVLSVSHNWATSATNKNIQSMHFHMFSDDIFCLFF